MIADVTVNIAHSESSKTWLHQEAHVPTPMSVRMHNLDIVVSKTNSNHLGSLVNLDGSNKENQLTITHTTFLHGEVPNSQYHLRPFMTISVYLIIFSFFFMMNVHSIALRVYICRR